MKRVVAMVAEAGLLDEVLQAAAVAGCEVERVVDVAALRGRWHGAPAVVLDAPGAQACAREALPRRPGVLVVSTGPPDPAVWPHAVELGVERVVDVSVALDHLRTALADLVESPSGGGRVLAVLGGCGGAGASVLAAAVGQAVLAEGGRALLVDCDPLGGGLDLALGAEGEAGVRWPEVELSGGRVPASALRSALPGRTRGGGALSFLSCARSGPDPAPQAVAAVVESGRRAGETVVCDVPRQLPPAACAALDRADLAVLVVPAEVRACAAARRVAEQVAERGVALHAVVRVPGPGGLRPRDVAEAVGIPLLTAMRPEPGLSTALDEGRFPTRTRGPLAKAARVVLAALHATDRLHATDPPHASSRPRASAHSRSADDSRVSGHPRASDHSGIASHPRASDHPRASNRSRASDHLRASGLSRGTGPLRAFSSLRGSGQSHGTGAFRRTESRRAPELSRAPELPCAPELPGTAELSRATDLPRAGDPSRADGPLLPNKTVARPSPATDPSGTADSLRRRETEELRHA